MNRPIEVSQLERADEPRRLRLPQIAAAFYCASIPFDAVALVGGRTITAIAGLMLIVAWLFDLSYRRVPPVHFGGVAATTLPLFGWALATLLWSPPGSSLTGALSLGASIAIFFILVDAMKGHAELMIAGLIVGTGVLSVWLYLFPNERHYGRATVGGADENEIAFQLALGLAALIWTYFYSRTSLVLLMGVGSFLGGAIFLTGSRTGFVAAGATLIGGLLVGIFFGLIRLRRAVLITILSGVGVAFVVFNSLLPDRVLSLLSGETGLRESSRASIERLYLNSVSDWWLFGVGYGSDSLYLQEAEGYAINAHGLFFKSWVELGAIGLTLVCIPIIWAATQAWIRGTIAGYMLFLTPAMAFAVTLAGLTLAGFWFVLAIAVSLPRQGRKNTEGMLRGLR